MQVFHKLEDVPAAFGLSLVTVGNFDGVHRAHAHVLGEIVQRARASGAQAVAVTFEPHPGRILRPDAALKLLTPLPEKLRLLEGTGIDAVLILPFGRDLSLMTPRQFAERILKKILHAREVHEGYNFRFGHKAAGDVKLLSQLGQEMGFEVKVYPRRTGESGAAFAGASVRHLRYTRARAWAGVEVHSAHYQSGALRGTRAERRRLHHLDARRSRTL
jgi:riboflavin kinase/FMN adenylyltransferase